MKINVPTLYWLMALLTLPLGSLFGQVDTTSGKISEALGSGKLILLADTTPGARAIGRKGPTFHGTVEVGGMYGMSPFMAAGSGGLRPVARGSVDFGLYGIPLNIRFDLGSNLMTQGWRNLFSLRLNTTKLGQDAQRYEIDGLGIMDAQLDSLNSVRSGLERKVRGAQGLSDLNSRTDSMASYETGGLGIPPELDNNVLDSLTPGAVTELQFLKDLANDSLAQVIRESEEELGRIKSVIGSVERSRELKARVIDTKKNNDKLGGLWSGIRRLEVGSITPSGSVFMLNGVTMQGVSYKAMMKRVFLSVDLGRSFDEAWRTRDRSSERLRSLQESIFLQDGNDLSVRKLTAIRTGIGAPEATHIHVGILRGVSEAGERSPVLGSEGGRVLNYVIELDAGIKVAEGHTAQVVIARSFLRGSNDAPYEGTTLRAMADRRSQMNQAIQLGWTSRFKRTRSEINLVARAIDPMFSSMGLAFVRTWSRSIDMTGTQPIGRRIRIKVGYKAEERTSDNGNTVTDIYRYRGQLMLRMGRGSNIRFLYMPMFVISQYSAPPVTRQQNNVIQFGMDTRKKVGNKDLLFTLDISRYDWKNNLDDGQLGEAWNLTGSARLSNDHWSIASTANTFSGLSDSTRTTLSISLETGWRSERTEIIGRAASGASGIAGVGWSGSIRRTFNKYMTCTISGGLSTPQQFYFGQDVVNIVPPPYYCEAMIGFTW